MNRLSLASGVVPEFGPVEIIRAAAAAGFDAVGLWIDPENWTDTTSRDCRHALADTGLELLDIEVIWLKSDSAMSQHRRSIDIGVQLGAANVLCVSSDPDHGATAARLAELCRHAEGGGMRVALEFGIFTEIRDLAGAVAILDAVAHPLRALLIDPLHVDRSDSPIGDIAALDPALLPYAQFCDAPAKRPDPSDFAAIISDAIDRREQCGAGALPLAELYRALPSGIPLSVELRSKPLRDAYPAAADRAKAVAGATRAWLAAQA